MMTWFCVFKSLTVLESFIVHVLMREMEKENMTACVCAHTVIG